MLGGVNMPKTKREVNNDFITFSKRLRELRESLNMTQKEFADYVGFTQATLSAYENSLKIPSLDIVMRIASNCKISIDWLCGFSNVKSYTNKKNTYSDAIRAIIQLASMVEMDAAIVKVEEEVINPDNGYPELALNNHFVLYSKDSMLDIFFDEWIKIKHLHDDKTIDDELYNLWAEKTCSNYDGALLWHAETKDSEDA